MRPAVKRLPNKTRVQTQGPSRRKVGK
jgi:hypothetical protein